ncbi:MAG: thioredoxin-dependent thiol peroxidase [Thaumarchaeota archaeon]|nr:thioredoxin-dependent thiol peroxidase [Nitrososphaerota archaeon]
MPKELQIGDIAPDFSLESDAGQKTSLKDFTGKKVVLYFYPKDDTPGCTKEACNFRDSLNSITSKDAVVLGVSRDSVSSHKKFKEKYSLNFPLLSDTSGEVTRAYGVYKKKNMYGVIRWGIERSTFIIDEEGKIAKIWRKVKVDGHKDEVLQTLKA